MKPLDRVIVALLVLIFVGAIFDLLMLLKRAPAPQPPRPAATNAFTWPSYMASQLPRSSPTTRGRVVVVTDSISDKSCKKGGGNIAILCIDTGEEWRQLVIKEPGR